MKNKSIAFPFLLTGIGVGWLATELEIVPGVNWAWIAGLGVLGILLPVVAGLDKTTVVAGPFLIICSLFSLLRQLDWIAQAVEVPALVTAFGLCMLLPFVLKVPRPHWYGDQPGHP